MKVNNQIGCVKHFFNILCAREVTDQTHVVSKTKSQKLHKTTRAVSIPKFDLRLGFCSSWNSGKNRPN